MPASYQFNVEVNGVALATQGQYLDWETTPYVYVSPLGIMTRGLIIGLGDQWRYADTASDPVWASADTSADPGWVISDI